MKRALLRVAGVAFVTAISACSAEREAAEPSVSSTAPRVVTLASADYAFQAPDTLDAGWTTLAFANNSDEIHYAHMVRLDSGRTVPELVAAYAEAIRTSGPRPKWVTRFGGPGGVAPGDTGRVIQQLEPGSYVWICPVEDDAGNPHFGKGEHKAFVVRDAGPDAGQGAAPVANATIRPVDHTFTLDAPLQRGRQTIRVENGGAEPHDVVLLKLAPGKTLDSVRLWLNPERARRPDERGDPGPPPGFPAGGIAAMAPGMTAYFETDLTAGDYVLACMVTAPDGRSHIEHGMIQQIRID